MDDSEGEEDEQKGGGGVKIADRIHNSLDNLVRFTESSGGW